QNSYYTVLRDGQEVRIDIPGDFVENFSRKDAASSFISPRIESVIGEISPKSLAEQIGLKVGDKVIELEGQPVTYQDQRQKIVRSGPRDSISLKVKRGEEVLAFKEDFKGKEAIGFYPRGIDKSELAHIQYGLGESIVQGTGRAFGVIFVQLKAFRKIFTGEI